MYYLAVLVVPLIMLADYYLTLWGAILRKRSGFAGHFVIEQYELNPTFQADVAKLVRFNPRHLFFVILLTALLLFLTFIFQTTLEMTWLFELLLGFAYTLYLVIIGVHLANLLTFRYLQTHPQQLTGEIRLGPEYTIEQSRNQLMIALVPLVATALVTRSFFVIGGVLGVLRIMVSYTLWQRRARLKAQRQARVVVESERAG